jgi:hypothetical protein
MKRFLRGLFFLCASCWACQGATIGAGTLLEVRLDRSLTSYSSKQCSEVRSTLIAPVPDAGDILVPQGAMLRGTLADVKRIG